MRSEMTGDPRLSHIDDAGRARMVDVTAKDETLRVAVAQVAGVMAAKRTHELIPMCHPLLLTHISLEFEPHEPDERNKLAAIDITATVRTTGKTGVEMEALTAVVIAGLTIYDMCKAVDRSMQLEAVRLVHKSGGKSGEWVNP